LLSLLQCLSPQPQLQLTMATPAASSSYACAAAPPPQSASNQEDDIFQEMLANHMNAPILPAHLMPERQASVQAALCTTRANNFPPANSQQQRYGPDELHYNAQQLGVSLEQIPLSRSPGRVHPCLFRTVDTLQEMIRKERQAHWTDGKAPCEVRMSRFVETKIGEHTQLGVFAIRDIKKGEYIDHYADCVCLSSQIQSSTWVRKVKGGQSFDTVTDGASLAWLYTRYVSSTAAGLQEMRNLPASAFWPLAAAVGDKVMQRFQELPVGCMVNSASSEYCAGRDLTNVLSQTKTYKACEYTLLIASRDIDQGDELLTRYYSHEETLLRGGWPPQPEPFAPAVRLYNCRATREFAAGAFIGWLWGMLATHGEWSDMTGVPAHDSHEAARRDKRKAAAAENFLQAIRLGIWRCLPVRTLKECNETNLTRLIVSERCPMAHLGAAVAGSTQANASLPRGDALTLQLDDPATCFRGLVVHATRAIAVGDIILIDQGGWTPQAWVERQAMAAGPSAPLAASASASSSISYLLPADLACTKRRKQDQQRQWENLKRFVEDNLAEYDSFPYAPFTASTGVDLSTVHVALGPSLLHPGILGVRLKPASHTTDGSASTLQHASHMPLHAVSALSLSNSSCACLFLLCVTACSVLCFLTLALSCLGICSIFSRVSGIVRLACVCQTSTQRRKRASHSSGIRDLSVRTSTIPREQNHRRVRQVQHGAKCVEHVSLAMADVACVGCCVRQVPSSRVFVSKRQSMCRPSALQRFLMTSSTPTSAPPRSTVSRILLRRMDSKAKCSTFTAKKKTKTCFGSPTASHIALSVSEKRRARTIPSSRAPLKAASSAAIADAAFLRQHIFVMNTVENRKDAQQPFVFLNRFDACPACCECSIAFIFI